MSEIRAEMATRLKGQNVFQDRLFTAGNVARVQNVRGEQLTAETLYFRPDQTLEYHQHPESEQVLIILEGEGMFALESSQGGNSLEAEGETTIAVKPGSVALAPAGVWHRLANTGGSDMVIEQVTRLPATSVSRPTAPKH